MRSKDRTLPPSGFDRTARTVSKATAATNANFASLSPRSFASAAKSGKRNVRPSACANLRSVSSSTATIWSLDAVDGCWGQPGSLGQFLRVETGDAPRLVQLPTERHRLISVCHGGALRRRPRWPVEDAPRRHLLDFAQRYVAEHLLGPRCGRLGAEEMWGLPGTLQLGRPVARLVWAHVAGELVVVGGQVEAFVRRRSMDEVFQLGGGEPALQREWQKQLHRHQTLELVRINCGHIFPPIGVFLT